jgi:hypothetical protein
LQGLDNLEVLKLEVIASDDYTGEVNEEEPLDPDGDDFRINMTDK